MTSDFGVRDRLYNQKTILMILGVSTHMELLFGFFLAPGPTWGLVASCAAGRSLRTVYLALTLIATVRYFAARARLAQAAAALSSLLPCPRSQILQSLSCEMEEQLGGDLESFFPAGLSRLRKVVLECATERTTPRKQPGKVRRTGIRWWRAGDWWGLAVRPGGGAKMPKVFSLDKMISTGV